MSEKEKMELFDRSRFDIHLADYSAIEIHRSGKATLADSETLVRMTTKAQASAQAFQSAMAGNVPPKVG